MANDTDPGPLPLPETWAVWRIDDNGNTFLVLRGLTRAQADQMAAEFTARGHKQMYWVEREVVAGSNAPTRGPRQDIVS